MGAVHDLEGRRVAVAAPARQLEVVGEAEPRVRRYQAEVSLGG